jgi:uncharacterized protein YbjT (DUF2867 family)
MIVITTPSGLIGHQVLDNLLDSGEDLRVIARDPSAFTADERDRVDVVEGSHADAAVVDEAFTDADAVFWLAPPDPQASSVEAAYVGFSRPATEAFKKHGVSRVVGISALGRGTPWAAHAGCVTGSLAMDDLIASTGVAYRALTSPSFMDNIVRQAEAIKHQGMFFSPIAGDRKLPAVATRDIATAASRLLLTRAGAASTRFRCSVPTICRSTTWPRSSRTSSARRFASSRRRSRPIRTGSSGLACPMRWLRA